MMGDLGVRKLHLGCGNVRLEGYCNIDLVPTPATDLVSDITRLPMFADSSIGEVRLEAVLEHLFRHERLGALREWRRLLQPGGMLKIAYVPDFDFVARAYCGRLPGVVRPVFDLEDVYRYTHGDPVPWNAAEQLHKDIFTRESLEKDLCEAGFNAIEIVNAPYQGQGHALNLNVTARKTA